MRPAEHAPFLLLPLRQQIRDGRLARWSDQGLSMLVTVIAHENARTRTCWPSFDRLATLAGVRRSSSLELVKSLTPEWLVVKVRPRRSPFIRLKYAPYRPGEDEAKHWLRISRALVMRGVWAAMAPSARRLYLTYLALGTWGHLAHGEWIQPDDFECDAQPFAFVPLHQLEPADVASLAGLEARTFRRAKEWLAANQLVQVSHYDIPGIIIPHEPDRVAPAIVERVEALKAEAKINRAGGRAKQSLRAVRIASKQKGQEKCSTKKMC